jgi:AAA+ superfamily predicted ATPase
MPPTPTALDPVNELLVLARSRHSLIAIDCTDPQRAIDAAAAMAAQLGAPLFFWTRTKGIKRKSELNAIYGTADSTAAFNHIEASRTQAVYVFENLAKDLEDPTRAQALRDAMEGMRGIDGAIILVEGPDIIPPSLKPVAAVVTMPPPTKADYVATINRVVGALQMRARVKSELSPADLEQMLIALKGLTLLETERLVTRAIMEDGVLNVRDISKVVAAKHENLKAEGLLEFCPVEVRLEDVAGLGALKRWLSTRRAVIADPARAADAGLPFPKGMLLVGVPGCGKSMCAKAVAADWGLPLLRMDTSGLFDKYVGESEKRFIGALKVAEHASPAILWIDEIEKAFSSGNDSDGGVTTRVLGTFLSWLQDRRGEVFVVATANDITRLPAEAVRKGRFDEIFFVDLPDQALRESIFKLHVAKRRQPPDQFDFPALAQRTEGFSGSEIEQAVVSACYAAFAVNQPVRMPNLMAEVERTVPLSTTMREKIRSLREWSHGRTVQAHP